MISKSISSVVNLKEALRVQYMSNEVKVNRADLIALLEERDDLKKKYESADLSYTDLAYKKLVTNV